MILRRFLDRLVRWSDPISTLESRGAPKGNTLTIVSVVYSTEAKTFPGPAIYITQIGDPIVASLPIPQPDTPVESSAQTTTDAGNPESAAPSTTLDTQTTSSSDLMTSTSTPTPVTSSITAPSTHVASTPSAGAASAASATQTAVPTSGGMSGGAKAGLAFGIILGLAFVGLGVFYLYRRQKEKQEHERLDDEKMAMTHPDVLPRHPEPEMAATAPHLSLRPLTQFNPSLSDNQRNAAPDAMPTPTSMSNLTPGAAAAAAHKGNTGLRQPGASVWERPGSRNAANDPANPFGNHAETITPNGSRPNTAQAPAPAPAQPVVAPAATPARAPSPQDVNAADFPLPSSAPDSPDASNFDSNVTSADSPSSTATDAVASAAAGAVVGAAITTAARRNNGSPKKPAPAPAPGPVHRVQMDFAPSMEDELGIHSGQLLRIKHEYDDGWALCELLDGSRSGVVPRSCLSTAPLKPRPTNGPPPNRPPIRGPPPPGAIPRPLTPGGGRNSPVPGVQVPRPLTPSGRNSPAPYAQSPRPMSPARPRARANSNASPYVAYQPQGRSMSPGPYGAGQLKPTPRPDMHRRRSKSVSQLSDTSASAVPAPLQTVSRKPVGGHKPSSPS